VILEDAARSLAVYRAHRGVQTVVTGFPFIPAVLTTAHMDSLIEQMNSARLDLDSKLHPEIYCPLTGAPTGHRRPDPVMPTLGGSVRGAIRFAVGPLQRSREHAIVTVKDKVIFGMCELKEAQARVQHLQRHMDLREWKLEEIAAAERKAKVDAEEEAAAERARKEKSSLKRKRGVRTARLKPYRK